MPHGESWFSFLSFYPALQAWAHHNLGESVFGYPVRVGHVVSFTFILLFLVLVGIVVRIRFADPSKRVLPEGKLTLTSLVEFMITAVYNMMSDLMGKKAARFFLPLIGACALVIFFSNVLGLIPGFTPPTDNLNTTVAMGSVIFVTTHVFGVKEQGFVNYFKHFFGPPLPWWIAWFTMPLMLVVETFSHFLRPFTLGIRLMANMTADHLVLGTFFMIFASMGAWFLPVPVALYLLGTLVAVIQTLVFCLLSSIYISMAIAHEEH